MSTMNETPVTSTIDLHDGIECVICERDRQLDQITIHYATPLDDGSEVNNTPLGDTNYRRGDW